MDKWTAQLNIGFSLSLALLAASCAFGHGTATPTVRPTIAAQQNLSPTSTPRPLERPATALPTPAIEPPTATPTAKVTPITNQYDRIPRSAQGDIVPRPTPGPSPNLGPEIRCAVSSQKLNLREGPGTSYRSISTLSAGVTVSARKYYPRTGWLLVETTTHEIGWAKSDFLACQSDPSTLPKADFPAAQAFQPATSPLPSPTATASTGIDQTPSPPSLTLDAWRAEYYDNASLLGQPILVRQEPTLEFNWFLTSPAPNMPADNFSARWTRLFDFAEGGDYRFFADADDGVRLYVDGWLIIDEWNTARPATHFGDFVDIGPGIHTLTVEYFESGGYANIKVWVEKTAFSRDKWRGEYYNNPDWRDPAAFVRQDEIIDFDWGNDSPADGIDNDNFSARWKRASYFDEGDYRFYADLADRDRVKIYLDDWLLVDKYRESSGRVEGFFDNVGAGTHTVTVEYRDDGDEAEIEVWWERE